MPTGEAFQQPDRVPYLLTLRGRRSGGLEKRPDLFPLFWAQPDGPENIAVVIDAELKRVPGLPRRIGGKDQSDQARKK